MNSRAGALTFLEAAKTNLVIAKRLEERRPEFERIRVLLEEKLGPVLGRDIFRAISNDALATFIFYLYRMKLRAKIPTRNEDSIEFFARFAPSLTSFGELTAQELANLAKDPRIGGQDFRNFLEFILNQAREELSAEEKPFNGLCPPAAHFLAQYYVEEPKPASYLMKMLNKDEALDTNLSMSSLNPNGPMLIVGCGEHGLLFIDSITNRQLVLVDQDLFITELLSAYLSIRGTTGVSVVHQDVEELNLTTSSFGIISVDMFLHLLSLEGIQRALNRIIPLLEAKEGWLIIEEPQLGCCEHSSYEKVELIGQILRARFEEVGSKETCFGEVAFGDGMITTRFVAGGRK